MGCLFEIMGMGAYSGEEAYRYLSLDAYSRKYGILELLLKITNFNSSPSDQIGLNEAETETVYKNSAL